MRSPSDLIVNLPAGMPDSSAQHDPPARIAASVLAEADLATVVTVATPIGVRRVFEWASQAAALGVEHPSVVVNHAPKSAYARTEIRAEINRVLEPSSITFVPADDRVRKAAWNGANVGRGPFLRAVKRAVGDWATS